MRWTLAIMSPGTPSELINRSRASPLDTASVITQAQASGQLRVHTGDRDDWILSNQTVNSSGRAVALPSWFRTCTPPPPSAASSSTRRNADAVGLDNCFRR